MSENNLDDYDYSMQSELWNAFCKMREYSKLQTETNMINLFSFTKNQWKTIKQKTTNVTLHIPYRKIALVDHLSLVVITFDHEDEGKPFKGDLEIFCRTQPNGNSREWRLFTVNFDLGIIGHILNEDSEVKTIITGSFIFNNRRLYDLNRTMSDDKIRKGITEGNLFHIRKALYEIHWINSTPDVILVERPKKAPHKNKKPLRYNQRSLFTIVKKGDIHRRIKAEGEEAQRRVPPIPHTRRGHYKTLSSPRYKKKQGRKIWIRSTTVNPSVEFEGQGRIYRLE